MENRDDKLIALVGLLFACLISVIFLFTMTWLSDIRHPPQSSLDVQSCYSQARQPVSPSR